MPSSAADGNMIDTFARFDLQGEIADCEQKKPWPSGHHAKTLFKKHDLRVVLIAMQPAAKMKEHHADGTISVQVLKGNIRFSMPEKILNLRAGDLLTLSASIKHEVESLDDSAFLLTISWPQNKELQAMEHRGYGT